MTGAQTCYAQMGERALRLAYLKAVVNELKVWSLYAYHLGALFTQSDRNTSSSKLLRLDANQVRVHLGTWTGCFALVQKRTHEKTRKM